MNYDLAVIGSGPAGQKGAIAAAKIGKRVVVIDRGSMLGGVCLRTGTIPSKTLREAVLHLGGFRQRAFYGSDYTVKADIRREDLMSRVAMVVERQAEVVHDQLKRNGVDMIDGTARFTGPHDLVVDTPNGPVAVTADHILIACGTRPARREDLPFDHPQVGDADQILDRLEGELATSAIVIGAGVIGLEYASMFAALGRPVTVIEARDEILGYVDREIIDHLVSHLNSQGLVLRLGQTVEHVVPRGDEIAVELASGEVITAGGVLYAVGRQPNTDRLDLAKAGLEGDARGRVVVDENYRTALPHVYAAGDVIGFPALASTSAEQGRVAACHMFGQSFRHSSEMLPYGIYTIPEISMVGRTERDLADKGIPYLVGRSFFRELAKAQIIGDRTGMLKLVFDPQSLKILGVHVIGDQAAELVHIGLAAMAAGATL
ncbi:MAG: Si-specific NAD(P)(+) transhydrogenase, partial [Planctomycetota bacterium]